MSMGGGGPGTRNGPLSAAVHPALVAIVTAIVVVAVLFTARSLADGRSPFGGRAGGTAASGGIDVSIDRVVTSLPDGRKALGTFTVRMNVDSIPTPLLAHALVTPTPVDAAQGPWVGRRTQKGPNQTEALLRERVIAAMSGLSYEETAGEVGKHRLRAAVRDSVNEVLPGAPVTQVFVREYLVQ